MQFDSKLIKEKNYFQIVCEKKAIKEVTNEAGERTGIRIEGFASTKDKDRTRDIVQPKAFKEALELYMSNPIMLLQHNADKPIGVVEEATIKPKWLYIKAKITEDIDGVMSALKNGVIRAFSIWYRVKDYEVLEVKDADDYITGYETVIKDLELYEISLVSIPANPYALMKSMDSCIEVVKKEEEVEIKEVKSLETEETKEEKEESSEEEVVETPTTPEEEKEDVEIKEEEKTEEEVVEETTDWIKLAEGEIKEEPEVNEEEKEKEDVTDVIKTEDKEEVVEPEAKLEEENEEKIDTEEKANGDGTWPNWAWPNTGRWNGNCVKEEKVEEKKEIVDENENLEKIDEEITKDDDKEVEEAEDKVEEEVTEEAEEIKEDEKAIEIKEEVIEDKEVVEETDDSPEVAKEDQEPENADEVAADVVEKDPVGEGKELEKMALKNIENLIGSEMKANKEAIILEFKSLLEERDTKIDWLQKKFDNSVEIIKGLVEYLETVDKALSDTVVKTGIVYEKPASKKKSNSWYSKIVNKCKSTL